MAGWSRGGKKAESQQRQRGETVYLELRRATGGGSLPAGTAYLFGRDRGGFGVRVHFDRRDGEGVVAVVTHLSKFGGAELETVELAEGESVVAAGFAALLGLGGAEDAEGSGDARVFANEAWQLDLTGKVPVLREVVE